MKQASNKKRISFQCDPTVYEYLKASMEGCSRRGYYYQINFLLEVVFGLREPDASEEQFQQWLKNYQATKHGQRPVESRPPARLLRLCP